MTGFVAYTYPQPPREWDQSWAAALIRSLQDAAALYAQLSELHFVSGSEAATGRWIDGRAVWMRVVPVTQAFLQTTGTSIAHGITGLGTVVRISGAFNNAGAHNTLPWFSVSGPMVLVRATATDVVSAVTGGTLWPGFVSGHVIIEYTKA